MAKRTVVTISDDLDGSAGAEPVSFGLDNRAYEIDLGPKNRAKLDKALKPYVEASRRVAAGSAGSKRAVGSAAASSGMDAAELRALRAWAEVQGFTVGSRGRIASSVIEAYRASN
jgi:uncharacterized membrane protein